ncbi:MAG: hypothetical protein ABIG69_03770 [Bacteroidota bacterium]
MVKKHKKYKKHTGVCTASAHVKKSKVTMKATCPITVKGTKAKVVKAKVKHHKRVELPAACKGMKHGSKRNECVKNVCDQRQEPYKTQCKKKAGLKKV